MKSLEQIRTEFSGGKITLSRHALTRLVERNISQSEIMEAGSKAIIIEDYPDDKYSPSCLLLGFTGKKRPLHIQVSQQLTESVKVITLYQPDENEWIDFSKRRQ